MDCFLKNENIIFPITTFYICTQKLYRNLKSDIYMDLIFLPSKLDMFSQLQVICTNCFMFSILYL